MRRALIFVLLLSVAPASAETPAHRPLAIVAEFDGIIHPVSAEFLIGAINEADASHADVVVIVLRTPGGLLDSTRDIVSRVITSRAPVVVFVGPSGSRAASAGFILTLAADVAVMAPGTHIGAAHPISPTGRADDDVISRKAASDLAAFARSLAEARGRNVALAAAAVRESRAFTDREALQAAPALIDFTASDVDELLARLGGRVVKRFDGRRSVLATGGFDVRRVDMTRRQRFLSAIAHPEIAYLLMIVGMLGLTLELWNPGVVLPGVAGALSLLLAFLALQILPMKTTGLLLILVGVGLLVLELKIPSGVLGIGGAVAIVVGSIVITDTVPGAPVSLGFVIPVALSFALVFVFLGRLAVASHRRSPVTGTEALIGVEGRARDPIAPDTPGSVRVRGELWRAASRCAIERGQSVRILGVKGLTLDVEPLTVRASRGES